MREDNAAARLHSLLAAVNKPKTGRTVVTVATVWRSAIKWTGTDEELVVCLCALLDEVHRTVDRLDDPMATRLYDQFLPSWLHSVLGPEASWTSDAGNLVDQGALVALDVLADIVAGSRHVESELEPEAVAELREALTHALAAVRSEVELPSEVQQLLIARLHDILWALDHLAVTGSEGVLAATERLAGAMGLNLPHASRDRPVVRGALKVAGQVWSAFKLGRPTQEALKGWQELYAMLPSGPEA